MRSMMMTSNHHCIVLPTITEPPFTVQFPQWRQRNSVSVSFFPQKSAFLLMLWFHHTFGNYFWEVKNRTGGSSPQYEDHPFQPRLEAGCLLNADDCLFSLSIAFFFGKRLSPATPALEGLNPARSCTSGTTRQRAVSKFSQVHKTAAENDGAPTDRGSCLAAC